MLENYTNENNRIESEVFTNAQDNQMFYLKYTHDQNGNLSLIEKFYPSGAKVKSYDFNYTPAGLLSDEVKYNEKGEIIHITS